MKAALKGSRDTHKNGAAAATFDVNAGNVQLRASITDATVINGPSLTGLTLAIEKPGSFIVDYNVPKKDFRFQFMDTVRFGEKPLNMTYIHSRGDNRTILNGTLVLDSANKVSANCIIGTKNCKLKYTYVHEGITTFEPCYDLAKNSWNFTISRRAHDDDSLKASYQTSSKLFRLEWSRNPKQRGRLKAFVKVTPFRTGDSPEVP